MVTIYDIAQKCGVSASTVSKVINNYPSIPLETRNKILKTMEEMNYIPNSSALYLSNGTSFNVGVLADFGLDISPFKHTLFTEILDSFQKEMNANKYDLLFISRNMAGKDASYYKNCISRHVDGVLLFGDMARKEMKEVIESSLPKIGFDYFGSLMSGVASNNGDMMIKMTEHLISLGHRRIVFVYGDDNEVTKRRILGFKKALSKHNIEFDDRMLMKSMYFDVNKVKNIIHELMSRSVKPTAIIFPDDYSAIRAINELARIGLKCPEDISIAGFDGINLGQLFTPRLTTVYQDTEKIGKILASKLINYMQNKKMTQENIEVPASLIVGESTRKI